MTPSPAERRRALGVDRWAVRDRRLSMAEALPFDGPNEVASWLRGQHAVRALRRGELTVMYPGGTPEVDAANWLAYHDGSPAWSRRDPMTARCPYRKCGQRFDTEAELDAHLIAVRDDADHDQPSDQLPKGGQR